MNLDTPTKITQQLRIGIAAVSSQKLATMRGRLEKSGLHIVVDIDLSKQALTRFGQEHADVLMVDLGDPEEAEQDLDLLETLTDEQKVMVPVLFYDGETSGSEESDKKLIRKLQAITTPAPKENPAEDALGLDEAAMFMALSGSAPGTEIDELIDASFESVSLLPTQQMPLNKPLGEILVERGKLKPADLQKALRLQEESEEKERLGSLLVKLGMVVEQDMVQALAKQFGMPVVQASEYPETPVYKELLSPKFLKYHKVMPLSDGPMGLIIALVNPQDDFARDAISMAIGDKAVISWVAVASEWEAAYERLYGEGKGIMGGMADDYGQDAQTDLDDIEKLKDLASEAPVIRMVNLLITRAVESRASDIHIEPFENLLQIRYRVDGVMREVESPPARLCPAVISRVKILSKLNIAERRLPQDGRIQVRAHGKEIDLRVSTLPTMYGESVVMRILDKESVVLDFAQLGYTPEIEARFRKLLELPHGIILVTGPTGSGKTTSLYTALSTLNTSERKILTVEDPIEYQLQGINQIQVKPSIGLTFAGALRAIVRQDPDVIMIGETRDTETAKIAVQSALTGHLVLSTIHANEAAGGITRLLDMGVEDFLLSSTVVGISAQRLVRKLCPKCKEAYPALPEAVAELKLNRFTQQQPVTLYRPKGCPECNGIGYRGRSVIIELLIMTEEIRRLILKRADAGTIQAMAQSQGMLTMYEDGLQKAVQGITTVEEVLRVTKE